MDTSLIDQLSPEYKAHYEMLLAKNTFGKDSVPRFHDEEDPYAEKDRSELEVVEFVIASYVKNTYLPKIKELKRKLNNAKV